MYCFSELPGNGLQLYYWMCAKLQTVQTRPAHTCCILTYVVLVNRMLTLLLHFFLPAFQMAVLRTCHWIWTQGCVKVTILVAVGVLTIVKPAPVRIQDHAFHLLGASRTVTIPQWHFRVILLSKMQVSGSNRVSYTCHKTSD